MNLTPPPTPPPSDSTPPNPPSPNQPPSSPADQGAPVATSTPMSTSMSTAHAYANSTSFGGGMLGSGPRFEKRPPKPTLNPKRVIGGIRLADKDKFILPEDREAMAAAEAHVETAGVAGEVETDDSADDAESAIVDAVVGEEEGDEAENDDVASAPASAPANEGVQGNGWIAQRWVRLIERFAHPAALAEGLSYARSGQTRTLEIKPGAILARVQGRMPTAYQVGIRLPMFEHMHWEQATGAMVSQARYAASILSGHLPPSVEDIFAPLGLQLFPTEPSDVAVSCTCADFKGGNPAGESGPSITGNAGSSGVWCKHACCVMYLIGERFSNDAIAILALRGLPKDDLLERLRQHRALAGLAKAGTGPSPVYTPHLPGLADQAGTPLDECVDDFWSAADPTALDELDLSISRPAVTHPLLRRLGPSPFTPPAIASIPAAPPSPKRGGGRAAFSKAPPPSPAVETKASAKFPLVGLLATCYEVVGEAIIRANSDQNDDKVDE